MTVTIQRQGEEARTIDLDAKGAVEEAEAIVRRAAERGAMLFDATKAEQIKPSGYKPEEYPEVLIVSPFAGG